MNIINNSMENVHKLNLIEVGILKIYLLCVSFLIAIWFPLVLSVHIAIYIIIAAVLYILLMRKFLTKNKNLIKRISIKWFNVHVLKKFSMLDMSLFKILILVIWFIIAWIFPAILTINIAWFTWLAGLWAGHFIGVFFKK